VTLRVRKVVDRECVTFILSGRIEDSNLPELRELIEPEAHIGSTTLDMGEVRLVDVEAIAFLAACEAAGIELKNCPSYVRVWIDNKRDSPNEA
jgi:hypothetical protein